jgi:hypothetical protein
MKEKKYSFLGGVDSIALQQSLRGIENVLFDSLRNFQNIPYSGVDNHAA